MIDDIKRHMKKNGALVSMMSGSGPTVFGIFDDPEKAQFAYRKLKEEKLARQIFLTEPFQNGGTKDAC